MKKIARYLAYFSFVVFVSMATFRPFPSSAQCSMCTLNAEQSVQGGNKQGRGLNNGILFLLAMPYLAVGAVGFLWYKHYRKKQTHNDMPKGPINLN